MFDPLPDDLAAAIAAAADRLGPFTVWRYLSETDSTNARALALAAAGAAEGTVLVADAQRAGRGRRGRAWFSPAGSGIYLSTVFRPSGDRGLALLTLAAGVAAARAVRRVSGLPVELKWPNDLVIGRPWRKLGGVLCETSGRGAEIDGVIVGIGINVSPAAYPRDLAGCATSIEGELAREADRPTLTVAVVEDLWAQVEQLRAGRRDAVCEAWRALARAGLYGAAVRWADHDVERSGRARDIAPDGALLVDHDGRTERLIAGEVRWEGLTCEP